MTIRQRWRQTALHNKLIIIIGGITAIGTVLAAVVPILHGAAPNFQNSEGALSPNIVSNSGNINIYGDANQHQSPSSDFENVVTWSVSFKIGGLIAAGPSDMEKNINAYVIGLPECRFYNLSTTQRRLIDLKLVIPTKDQRIPALALNTQSNDFLFKRPKLPGIIDMPIILEPSSSLEGRIDFITDHDISDRIRQDQLNWMQYEDAVVYVTEHRSGKTVKVKIGESYDAATGIIMKP